MITSIRYPKMAQESLIREIAIWRDKNPNFLRRFSFGAGMIASTPISLIESIAYLMFSLIATIPFTNLKSPLEYLMRSLKGIETIVLTFTVYQVQNIFCRTFLRGCLQSK